MYNLRYHIASLISVFLALALGLILGGLIVGTGEIDDQGNALVDSLRKEFTALREENALVKAEQERTEALSSAMVTAYVEGKLGGRTVVLITGAGRTDGEKAAQRAIEDAGGKVALVRLMHPQLGLDDPTTRSEVATLAGESDRPLESLATSLAIEWFSKDSDRPLTKQLSKLGIIDVSGLETKNAAAGVIDLAAFEKRPDAAGIAIAAWAHDANVPAAGAQAPDGEEAVAAAAAARGISAFDTLGTQIGRYTAVALMYGAEPGNYGFAQGTDDLFPPVKP